MIELEQAAEKSKHNMYHITLSAYIQQPAHDP